MANLCIFIVIFAIVITIYSLAPRHIPIRLKDDTSSIVDMIVRATIDHKITWSIKHFNEVGCDDLGGEWDYYVATAEYKKMRIKITTGSHLVIYLSDVHVENPLYIWRAKKLEKLIKETYLAQEKNSKLIASKKIKQILCA